MIRGLERGVPPQKMECFSLEIHLEMVEFNCGGYIAFIPILSLPCLLSIVIGGTSMFLTWTCLGYGPIVLYYFQEMPLMPWTIPFSSKFTNPHGLAFCLSKAMFISFSYHVHVFMVLGNWTSSYRLVKLLADIIPRRPQIVKRQSCVKREVISPVLVVSKKPTSCLSEDLGVCINMWDSCKDVCVYVYEYIYIYTYMEKNN